MKKKWNTQASKERMKDDKEIIELKKIVALYLGSPKIKLV